MAQASRTSEVIVTQTNCMVDGCRKPVKARGLCGMHYARYRKSGELSQFPAQFTKAQIVIVRNESGQLVQAKECSRCHQIKPLSEFSKGGRHIGGVMANCKSCMSERWARYYSENRTEILEQTKEQKRLYYELNRERMLQSARERYYTTGYYEKNKARIAQRARKYRQRKPLVNRGIIQRRRAKKRLLPDTATTHDYEVISREFGYRCALTGSPNYTFDHFIPLNWGHGGTYYGNLVPLDASLNIKKSDKNPVVFFREMITAGQISEDRFRVLVEYLATINGLTPNEFVEFVHWCESNKRTAAQIQRDGGRSSVELWRDACMGGTRGGGGCGTP